MDENYPLRNRFIHSIRVSLPRPWSARYLQWSRKYSHEISQFPSRAIFSDLVTNLKSKLDLHGETSTD